MILPPGKYFIGDPCYAFKDDDWQKLLHVADCFETNPSCLFGGKTIYAHNTAFGDGTYLGSNAFEFGVDSGLLGAVPIELIESLEDISELGIILDAPEGLRASFEDGTFYFSAGLAGDNLTIETNDSQGGWPGGERVDDWLEVDYFDNTDWPEVTP